MLKRISKLRLNLISEAVWYEWLVLDCEGQRLIRCTPLGNQLQVCYLISANSTDVSVLYIHNHVPRCTPLAGFLSWTTQLNRWVLLAPSSVRTTKGAVRTLSAGAYPSENWAKMAAHTGWVNVCNQQREELWRDLIQLDIPWEVHSVLRSCTRSVELPSSKKCYRRTS